jgi:hypothetical protein
MRWLSVLHAPRRLQTDHAAIIMLSLWSIDSVEINVRPISLPAAFLVVSGLSAIGGSAWAQSCTLSTGTSKNITATTMTTLLTNNYACAYVNPTEQWNELHNGTQVLDYKKGPTDPIDPSDTPAHPTGTYSITGTDSGIVTYNYGAGGTYGYTIKPNQGTLPPTLGVYSFCTTTGGINIAVTLQSTHCAAP